MTKYIPTDAQRAAYYADHSTRETAQSIVRMIGTGRKIDRALVRRYLGHDVDTTGVCDTVGTYAVEIVVGGDKFKGYAVFAFNMVNGVPIAADFRDFIVTVTAEA